MFLPGSRSRLPLPPASVLVGGAVQFSQFRYQLAGLSISAAFSHFKLFVEPTIIPRAFRVCCWSRGHLSLFFVNTQFFFHTASVRVCWLLHWLLLYFWDLVLVV